MSKVRVRIAPSPTGVPHIGNTRTVLFNWLFARKNKGEFIVRVEDTDQTRYVEGALEKILEILEFLGLDWDEGPKKGGKFGPYIQSERKELYQKYAADLVKKDQAYKDEGAVRFRVEKGKVWKWQDIIHGEIFFKSDVIEDFVILKSDGFPTYHLAVVIDDHLMNISHVLRGDEWISSTPKHLMLYDALGWDLPQFGHLPIIVDQDKSKLSKRHGAKSVLDYRDEGYLPEALINFMALLGWSPPPEIARKGVGEKERELFSKEELTDIFSLDRINSTSPVFNLQKLDWFNNQWIKRIDDVKLAKEINKVYPKYPLEKLVQIMPLVKERMTKLTDFPSLADFLFNPPDLKSIPQVPVSTATISLVRQAFNTSSNFDASAIKDLIENASNESEEKNRVGTITAIRNIISGSEVTPPLYESLERLGKEETVRRLDEYLKKTKK